MSRFKEDNNNFSNIFKHSKKFPFHLSVGGIVIKDNRVMLQYKKTKGIYRIPSETVEVSDTIITIIKRLGQEELGLHLVPLHFLGCSNNHIFIDNNGLKVYKTTLYFLCKSVGKIKRTPLDIELMLYNFVWVEIDKAFELLKARGRGEHKFLKLALKQA